MLRLIKLKFAININLTTLDQMYHTTIINITDQKKLRRKLFQRKNIKFKMHRREFWERQFTVFPCKFYRNLPLTGLYVAFFTVKIMVIFYSVHYIIQCISQRYFAFIDDLKKSVQYINLVQGDT